MLKRALGLTQREHRPREMLCLIGENVTLRDKRPEDIADDYQWGSDPELSKLDGSSPLDVSFYEYRRYARDLMRRPARSSRRFSIETRDGHHIGNCMYYDIDKRRGQAEIGILIGDRDYWGLGYGRDALETMVEHIFTSTHLTVLLLHTLDWNARARASFARVGFAETRRVRRNGLNFIRMEMTRADWKRRLLSAASNASDTVVIRAGAKASR